MPILFAAIADGDRIVCSHPTDQPKLLEVCNRILRTIGEGSNARMTFEEESYDFHYKAVGRRVIFAVSDKSCQLRVVNKFLDAINLIISRHPDAPPGKPKEVPPAADQPVTDKDVQRLGWPKRLRDTFAFWNDPANDKITAVTAEVEGVTSIMLENVQRVIQRGDQLDHLTDISHSVMGSAQQFESQAITLRRTMCRRHLQVTLLCIAAGVVCRCELRSAHLSEFG